jgi:hypothetical protein
LHRTDMADHRRLKRRSHSSSSWITALTDSGIESVMDTTDTPDVSPPKTSRKVAALKKAPAVTTVDRQPSQAVLELREKYLAHSDSEDDDFVS